VNYQIFCKKSLKTLFIFGNQEKINCKTNVEEKKKLKEGKAEEKERY